MTRKKFKDLVAAMPPERQARIKQRTEELIREERLLREARRQQGLTQAQLAAQMGISQPALSKLENQDDMQISTLRKAVKAMGGELEITAHLPDGDVHFTSFAG